MGVLLLVGLVILIKADEKAKPETNTEVIQHIEQKGSSEEPNEESSEETAAPASNNGSRVDNPRLHLRSVSKAQPRIQLRILHLPLKLHQLLKAQTKQLQAALHKLRSPKPAKLRHPLSKITAMTRVAITRATTQAPRHQATIPRRKPQLLLVRKKTSASPETSNLTTQTNKPT